MTDNLRDSGNSSVPLPAERGNKQNKPAPNESRNDLRTRIAAVLRPEYTYDPSEHPDEWTARIADAVIRELGLQRRTGQGPYSNQVWYQTDWIIE